MSTGPIDNYARQPGNPNLLRGNPAWVKGGESPNKGGKSKYQSELDAAIEAQESPERVCQVVAAMHALAISGDAKGSPAAAKVYLGAVGVDLNKASANKLDLEGAPKELVDGLTDWISKAPS
jgi:hypothetical protein